MLLAFLIVLSDPESESRIIIKQSIRLPHEHQTLIKTKTNPQSCHVTCSPKVVGKWPNQTGCFALSSHENHHSSLFNYAFF
jgi:hypothetical protein